MVNTPLSAAEIAGPDLPPEHEASGSQRGPYLMQDIERYDF
jgi:hypothetical protein